MNRDDLLFLTKTLMYMYADIITYLHDVSKEEHNEDYKFARLILDKIFKNQNDINKMYKKYKDEEDLTTDEFIELIDLAYKDIYNAFNIIQKKEIDARLSRYQSSYIFNNISKDEINLEKLLREDVKTKAAKTYFDILDEEYGMTLDKYLFYHELPEDKKDLSDEQAVIRDIIYSLEFNLYFSLHDIYGNYLFKYLYYQEDLNYYELKNTIQEIFIYKEKISYIIFVWLDKDSSLNKLIDVNKIHDEVYNECLDIWIRGIENPDILKAEKYKDIIINPDKDYELEDLLEEDAYTDNAKRYFGLDIIEKEK